MSTKKDRQRDSDVVTRERKKTQKPKRYKVLFHNDHYTTMEFVVHVLETVFRKSGAEATMIMLHVHQNGSGIAGVYPFSIAETKVAQTKELAQREGHPLMVTMEPE